MGVRGLSIALCVAGVVCAATAFGSPLSTPPLDCVSTAIDAAQSGLASNAPQVAMEANGANVGLADPIGLANVPSDAANAGVGCLVPGSAPVPRTVDCRAVAGVVDEPTTSDCATIQPGVGLHMGTLQCTAGFLFKGSNGRTYVTTAGHCADPKVGSREVRSEDSRRHVGHVVWFEYDAYHQDVAFIELDRGVHFRGALENWGGPKGQYRDTAVSGAVHMVGRGVGVSLAANARSGTVLQSSSVEYVLVAAPAVSNDSGSPVITAYGEALGLIEGLATGTIAGLPPGQVGVVVMRIAPAIPRAERVLHMKLQLLTSALI